MGGRIRGRATTAAEAVKAFEAEYGDFGAYGPPAYESMAVLLDAIQRAYEADGEVTREGVVREMAETMRRRTQRDQLAAMLPRLLGPPFGDPPVVAGEQHFRHVHPAEAPRPGVLRILQQSRRERFGQALDDHVLGDRGAGSQRHTAADLARGDQIHLLEGHEAAVTALAVSDDCRRLVSARGSGHGRCGGTGGAAWSYPVLIRRHVAGTGHETALTDPRQSRRRRPRGLVCFHPSAGGSRRYG